VNIHRVLEHVRKLAQTGFAAHLRFQENYDPSLPPVHGNRDQLVQVVLNLVKNAAEAITADGDSHPARSCCPPASARHAARRAGLDRAGHLPLYVAVRDNGPGIPEDIRRICSSRSSPPRPPAAAWAWRWSPRSSATMAG
jgi:two-component system nitrogen regulation sensor histidine kinase GlnL